MKRGSIILLIIFTLIWGSMTTGCGSRSDTQSTAGSTYTQEQPTFSSEQADLEHKIKQAFIDTYADGDKSVSLDDLSVRFYGKYSGAYAVFVDGYLEYEETETVEKLGNCEFKYPTTQTLLLYMNGAMMRLSTAYRGESFSEEDLENLHGYYLGHNLYLYKTYCQATLEDNFSGKQIMIMINPLYNFKEYTTEDFAEINCVEVRDIWTKIEGTQLCRIMLLTLEGDSKENVLNAVKLLEQRDDIYNAAPDYVLSGVE